MNILFFILYFLFTLIHLSIIERSSYNKLKTYSLVWSLGGLFLFILICIFFDSGKGFQFFYLFNWVTSSQYNWGLILFAVDGISLCFIGLTLVLIPIIYIISWNSVNYLLKEYIICIHLTLTFLVVLFSVLEIISFYIFFEVLLIPVFIIIGVWGSRKQKTEASFYFFFYTLAGSFLMLLSIFKLYNIYGITDYNYLLTKNINSNIEFWIFIGFFISLSIKIPMIPFHLWLPKAHVEAPIAGSILLAGILLKLGGYGMIRFIIPMFPNSSEYFKPVILTLSFVAIIYGALVTLNQNDVKKLIAYSSISHMGFVTLTIFTFSFEGLLSSLSMMVAHGLISSGLFMSAFVLYSRHHTRALKYYKGLVICMPLFTSINLILILSNMGFPLSLNFISEVLCLKSIIQFSFLGAILISLGCFLTTVYSLFMYNRIHFGVYSTYIYYGRDLTRQELYSFLPILFFTLFFGVLPNFMFTFINKSNYHLLSLT